MVRRSRHRNQGSVQAPAPEVAPVPDASAAGLQGDRTAIFQKTKMCKFFILGMCAKGTQCRFAHDRSEMHDLPNLFRTKLCKTLINTGDCTDPACRYAHSKEEMRNVPDGEEAEGNMMSARPAVNGMTPTRAAPEVPTPSMGAKFPSAAPSAPSAPSAVQGQTMQEAMLQQMGQMSQFGPGMLAQAQAQIAMLQMWQAAQASQAQSAQLQALLMQGGAPQGMQNNVPGGMQDQLPPGALFGGIGQSEQFDNDDDFNQSARMPGVSDLGSSAPVNAGHLNSLAQEHKAVAAAAAAASLHVGGDNSLGLDAPEFTPVLQSAHEPALIAPSSLRSIKSSSSICSMGGQLDTVAEDETPDQALGSSWDGYPSYTNGLVVKNTFLQEAVEQSPSGMRLIASAAGRLDSLGGEATPTPTESLVRPRDNLANACEEPVSPESMGRGQAGAPSRSNLHSSGFQVTGGLRPSSSWGSRLDVLAEECAKVEDSGLYRASDTERLFARQVSPGSGMPASALAGRPASPGDALRSPEKRLQDTPFAAEPGSRMRHVASGAGSLSALAEEREDFTDADISVMQSSADYLGDEAHLSSADLAGATQEAWKAAAMQGNAPPLADMQWKVKNTFLDFEPCEPKGLGLRAVHTAAGRLDLMG